jgi:Biotin/lipoate A/B protein ligase family
MRPAFMSLRTSPTERILDLPPLFEVVPLREAGDAFAHACAIADARGAGTLVWVRRYDLVEFAVVLEPEEPLASARRAIYAGTNALADALIVHAPPARPVAFDWPDAIRVDGVLVGGGRLGWPDGIAEHEVPPWLVFSGMIRASAIRGGEPGLRPLLGALDELGFEAIDAGEIVASFARHLMAGLHEWSEGGFAPVAKRWLGRLPRKGGRRLRLADNGDLLIYQGANLTPGERRNLARALATPSWLDPATGAPWL